MDNITEGEKMRFENVTLDIIRHSNVEIQAKLEALGADLVLRLFQSPENGVQDRVSILKKLESELLEAKYYVKVGDLYMKEWSGYHLALVKLSNEAYSFSSLAKAKEIKEGLEKMLGLGCSLEVHHG